MRGSMLAPHIRLLCFNQDLVADSPTGGVASTGTVPQRQRRAVLRVPGRPRKDGIRAAGPAPFGRKRHSHSNTGAWPANKPAHAA